MKWLLVLSVLLSLAGCGTFYELPVRRVSTLSHGTFDEPVQAQTTRISEREQIEIERRNLDTEYQQLDTGWRDYLKEDANFAASLDDQQLEAYSEEKQASKSTDIALITATIRKFRTLLPKEKDDEYRQLLKKNVELSDRSNQFAKKIDTFNQRVDAYNAKEEAARQAIINFFAFQQQRSLIREQMMQQSQQQEQAQRQREQDRIWLHNELQNLKPSTYWQEELAREQWNEKWQEKFKIHSTPLVPAPIIYPK